MYNKSPKHLENLEKARSAGVENKKECTICGKSISLAGFANHKRACEKGKKCPICEIWFSGKGTTCSRGCANSYFRSGLNNPNWKASGYRTTCFLYHEFKCVVCGEDKILEVHHFDEDKGNNEPENLVPLCPTHHQYFHSRFQGLIIDKIVEYIENWKNTNSGPLDKSPLPVREDKVVKFVSRWRDSNLPKEKRVRRK